MAKFRFIHVPITEKVHRNVQYTNCGAVAISDMTTEYRLSTPQLAALMPSDNEEQKK